MILRSAVHQVGYALVYASESLKKDREVVIAAVQTTGAALKHAPEVMQGDKAIVFTAVRNDGLALKYAARSTKADWEIVFTLGGRKRYRRNTNNTQQNTHRREIPYVTVIKPLHLVEP